jgi:hypothetical protein
LHGQVCLRSAESVPKADRYQKTNCADKSGGDEIDGLSVRLLPDCDDCRSEKSIGGVKEKERSKNAYDKESHEKRRFLVSPTLADGLDEYKDHEKADKKWCIGPRKLNRLYDGELCKEILEPN